MGIGQNCQLLCYLKKKPSLLWIYTLSIQMENKYKDSTDSRNFHKKINQQIKQIIEIKQQLVQSGISS